MFGGGACPAPSPSARPPSLLASCSPAHPLATSSSVPGLAGVKCCCSDVTAGSACQPRKLLGRGPEPRAERCWLGARKAGSPARDTRLPTPAFPQIQRREARQEGSWEISGWECDAASTSLAFLWLQQKDFVRLLACPPGSSQRPGWVYGM